MTLSTSLRAAASGYVSGMAVGAGTNPHVWVRESFASMMEERNVNVLQVIHVNCVQFLKPVVFIDIWKVFITSAIALYDTYLIILDH